MLVLLLSAAAPALLIMYLVYRHDLNKEPIRMLAIAFLGGVLSIFLSLLFSTPLSMLKWQMPPAFIVSFYDAFFLAAIPEELAKWLIFYWLIRKAKDFDQYYDGILYAIFISMGFALVENILYVLQGGLSTAILRAVLSVPGHMLFAIPMGYYLSLSKFQQGALATKHQWLSILIPVALHGTFDFILMYADAKKDTNAALVILLFLAFVAFDIYMWRLGLRKLKAMRERDKASGV
ncbi:MAG: protease PrsW [Flavobacteriia bacterium]|nr:protease PrsW [Flavobacteriia bacterium]